MSEHTKGPWRILPEEVNVPYIRVRGTIMGGAYKIANIHHEEFFLEEGRANARVIAAAPELLEALKRLLPLPPRESPHSLDCGCCYCEAVKAINKAEGK